MNTQRGVVVDRLLSRDGGEGLDCTCYVGPSAPPCPVHRTLRDRCQRAVFEADVDDPLYPLGSPEDRYLIVDAVLAVVAAELKVGAELAPEATKTDGVCPPCPADSAHAGR